MDLTYDYLSIPLKYSMKFGVDMAFITSAGIVPSFLLSSKMIVETTPNHEGYTIDMKDNIYKVDLAGQIDAGVNYTVSDKFHCSPCSPFKEALR